MPILVDFNQISFASIVMETKNHKGMGFDPNLARHFILNSLRSYNKQYGPVYGEMIICGEGGSWRKDVFPLYKYRRSLARDTAAEPVTDPNAMDWDLLFETVNEIRDSIKNFFPWKVVSTRGAEADDCIAVLAYDFSNKKPAAADDDDFFMNAPKNEQRTLIISGDKDFQQLQVYGNVDQFSPTLKRAIKCDNPVAFRREHILRGDAGDDIPNVLSPDDIFTKEKGRQGSIQQDIVEEFIKYENFQQIKEAAETSPALKRLFKRIHIDELEKNYYRNLKTVDLVLPDAHIPQRIIDAIRASYEEKNEGSLHATMNYFQERRLRNLLSSLNDFKLHK